MAGTRDSGQTRRVLVSGCFDLLHSGHVRFFQEAASYGDLYVALGSDRTVADLKGRAPVTSQEERLYMVRALACVREAFVSSGSGRLDFQPEMEQMRPEVFLVNQDGDHPEKARLAERLGAEYVVLARVPRSGLLARSTTDLRQEDLLPYRIDLCGGWLDQPFVSSHHAGPVLTVSLEPTHAFNERSGMATSTRRTARKIWGSHLPPDPPEKLARILFACDNPPGTQEVSGSQDAIGLVFPGLAVSHYAGAYWPERIDHITDPDTLAFIENHLWLIPLDPRAGDYDVLADTHIDGAGAARLAGAATACAEAIARRDLTAFGASVRAGFEAQIAMFPGMAPPEILAVVDRHAPGALGWKVSGAGGGGYLILVSQNSVPEALRVTIRRPDR